MEQNPLVHIYKNIDVKPWNINWQLTLTGIGNIRGFHPSQSKQSTSQCIWRIQIYGGRHWNYWITSSFSIILILHKCYVWILLQYLKKQYVTIEFLQFVLRQFKKKMGRLSFINIFCSFGKTRGVTIDLEIGIPILCFWLRLQRVRARQFHCDVECFDWGRRKSQTMHISNSFNQLMLRDVVYFTIDH